MKWWLFLELVAKISNSYFKIKIKRKERKKKREEKRSRQKKWTEEKSEKRESPRRERSRASLSAFMTCSRQTEKTEVPPSVP